MYKILGKLMDDDFRKSILQVISAIPCERCKKRKDFSIQDCAYYNCQSLYEQEADAVIALVEAKLCTLEK